MNNSKSESKKQIEAYFSQDKLDSKETKKIKKIAMTHRIRLKEYRKRFCKKCFSDLNEGRVRISKTHKQVTCKVCSTPNRWKIK